MRRMTKRKELDAILAVSRRFGTYKDEEKKAVRVPDVENDEILDGIKKEWGKLDPDNDISGRFRDGRRAAWSLMVRFGYTSRDVERFSVALAEFQDEECFSVKAGTFISALIDRAKGSEYVVYTGHLKDLIDVLGFENRKSVVVRGNAGKAAGAKMKSGLLVIEGNVAERAGLVMEGGRIVVKGNAGDEIGMNMTGGEIQVDGKMGSIGHVIHGKIYHKGKLIVDK